ncbi:MAG: hypothetical protein R3E12_09605 [Candidatus Eisenbacteria bacterium]
MPGRLTGDAVPSEAGRCGATARPAPATDFEAIVDHAFDPIRRYGAGHFAVVESLLASIGRVGECCELPERRALLGRYATETRAAYRATEPQSDRDVERIEDRYRETRRRLGLAPDADRRAARTADPGPNADSAWISCRNRGPDVADKGDGGRSETVPSAHGTW